MSEQADHFKQAPDGHRYAGDHLLIEFWGAGRLNDPVAIQEAMEASARAAGATLLHSHYHQFGGGGGVSGVTVLAESHITIHTWPERGYAAIDIFMCGDCNPNDCLPELEKLLTPSEVDLQMIERGRRSSNAVKEVA